MQTRATGSKTLPPVSVVIPAYNEEKCLPRCLESIRKQDYLGEYEVIVVDNASTDDTAKIAISWGAKVVYEDKRSPACARQKGAEAARGEIVAFTDADTRVPACWLSVIVSRFMRESETVVIGGPFAYFDVGKITKIASYITNFIAIILDQLFRKAFNKGGALWGSNFAVRRLVLLEVGGFDTSIKFYGEEYELSLKLKKTGKGGIIPRLFVLSSARRLRRLGIVTQYWNWIVDYFAVLFWYRPIPERLEDWPTKARYALLASISRQKLATVCKYVGLLICLAWLHTSPLLEAFRKLVYLVDISGLGFLFIYHAVSPASQLYGRVRSNGERGCRQIALSFDDGPSKTYTTQVLNVLAQYDIKATFFVIGQNVRRYPEVCREVLRAGHVIGNHSYHHHKLLCLRRNKTTAREVHLANQAIYQSTGVEVKLFRPPHGLRTPWFMRTLRRLGYTVVTWDNMTDDWKAGKPAQKIFESIVKRARPGSIIVLHDGRSTRDGYDRSQMLQALPKIIEKLKEKEFDFITVPQILQPEVDSPVKSLTS